MLEICITICIVVALICGTICFIYKENLYSGADFSEQQLLEDIHAVAVKEFDRNQNDIESNNDIDENGTLYVAANNTLSALDTIITLTKDYRKECN